MRDCGISVSVGKLVCVAKDLECASQTDQVECMKGNLTSRMDEKLRMGGIQ